MVLFLVSSLFSYIQWAIKEKKNSKADELNDFKTFFLLIKDCSIQSLHLYKDVALHEIHRAMWILNFPRKVIAYLLMRDTKKNL